MEKLTLQQAIDEVKDIDNIKYDDEMAHSSEDDLHVAFIESIANGLYSDISEMEAIAKEIIKTKEIDFSRWCA